MDLRGTDKSLPLAMTDPVGSVGPPRGAPGHVLAGKYELVREIGRGGMGVVWLAERIDWDRAPVAVKLMVSTLDSPAARARFDREAQTAVKLRSTHVVQVIDHGIDEKTDTPFLVMELLEGESLRGRLERLTVLSPEEVMLVVSHLGRALTRAQRFHVVHRDLKPENVFLADNGDEPTVKVLDFGLAKVFDDTSMTIDSQALTKPGNVVGTPWYMSPEQIRRADPDHRGDLWSLAVITFECLVGQRPFGASDLGALAVQIFTDDRPVPSKLGSVPPGFDAWFATATDPDLEQRFQTAEELVEALAAVCGSSRKEIPPLEYERHSPPRTSSLAPVTRGPEARPFLRRHVALLFGAMGGIVLGTGAIYLGTASHLLTRAASVASPASATATQALLPPPASAPLATASTPGQLAGAVPEPAAAAPPPLQTGMTAAFVEAPARVATAPVEPASIAPLPPVVTRSKLTKPTSRPPKAARQRRSPTPVVTDNMAELDELDGRNYRTDL